MSGDCSLRMGYGFCILVLLIMIEIGFSATAITFITPASKCTGGAGSLSLPAWILIGGIIGCVMNGLFLLWYCIRSLFYASNGRSQTDELFGCFVCCICGTPIGTIIILSILFRFAWVIAGALLVANISTECKTEFQDLFNMSIVFFFVMAASLFAKFIVVSKKCPCDA